jgi:2-keto-4-pentenoate hydratase/2-oxohepta-3-ene-1,7-dioic acid hydratase in catechol pathway
MRLMRLGEMGQERPVVMLADGAVLDCSQLVGDFDPTFFASGELSTLAQRVEASDLPTIDASKFRIGAPVARPQKIVCVGMNYTLHVQESGGEMPKEPVLFMKSPGTLVGPDDHVVVPRKSEMTDWEVELAVVIGKRAKYIESPDVALSYVAGYAISNDVSEREFQLLRGGQWDKGKNCETFNPMGPWVLSADEVSDPQTIDLRLSVNGVLLQNDSTKNMIFPVAYLLWYISQFMVLEPGDIVNTGTPAGVSLGHDDVSFVRPGDVMELEGTGLGRQRQVAVAAE